MTNHKSSKGTDKIVPTFFISDFSLPTHYRNHQYHNFNTPQNSQSSTSYLSAPPYPPPMFGFFSAIAQGMSVEQEEVKKKERTERKKNKRKIFRVELVVYHRVLVI